jgi:molecular chaperone GrpE
MNKEKTTENTEELEQETVEETTDAAEVEEVEEKDPLAELNEQYLRLAAEYDNFRRRSQKEKEQIYTDSYADVIEQLLPIIDNLERAAMFEGGDKVLEGLVMTAKATISVFEKLGIEEVGKVGEKFDPNLHNAVLHIDDDAYGEGEIVEVFQKGYKKGKRIIRFAMVKTAN